METAKPPSGHAIHEALLVELTNNLYRLPSTTIAPTLFHVYLQQDDFETLEGIVPRLASELASALTRDVERLNAGASPGGLLAAWLRKPTPAPPAAIEIPVNGWEIVIQPDLDGDVPRGAFGIVSKLTIPPKPEFAGPPTVRTIRTVVADGRPTSSVVSTSTTPSSASDVIRTAQMPALSATATPSAAAAPVLGASVGGVAGQTTRKPAEPRALLSYTDDNGAHMFPVQKDVVKIGRGGSGTWVDLQLVTGPKVSREHCWIRCDEAGQFFIRDTSTWGTSVNGRPIAGARRSPGGEVVEPGPEEPLPAGATIDLADTLVIQVRSTTAGVSA